MKKILILISVVSISYACASVGKKTSGRVLFVHGANLKAWSWHLLRTKLHVSSTAIELPGRNDELPHKEVTLKSSTESLCEKLTYNDTLIAHSQAGAIVNHAIGLCPEKKIKKIIYISAVVPMPGETAFQKLSKEDESFYFRGITYVEGEASMVITSADKYLDAFAQDAGPEEKRFIWMNSTDEPSKIGDDEVNFDYSEYERIQKVYIRTLKDKIIGSATQDKILANSKIETVYDVDSRHLPMVTELDELLKILKPLIK